MYSDPSVTCKLGAKEIENSFRFAHKSSGCHISYDCNLEFVLGRIQDEFVMNQIT